MSKVEGLDGKKALIGEGLTGFMWLMQIWGMTTKPDNFNQKTTLAERFVGAGADLALYSVTDEEFGRRILELPEDIKYKFVIFQNNVGMRIPKIGTIYGEIMSAGIPCVWEGLGWTNEVFQAAMLRAIAGK